VVDPTLASATTISADSTSLVVASPGPEPAGAQLVVPIEEPASQTLATVRLFVVEFREPEQP
jgi:hypothetical protein